MNKYYTTTPIYYVNDVPHIGHAYTTVAADVLARYYQQKLGAENVFFLTGTDEHGAKIAQAAKEAGLEPKAYVDSIAPRFQETWDLLNIKPDHFIRTTDPRHKSLAQEVLQKIYDKGFIYESTYEGLYCVGCEKFLAQADLLEGKCPLHPNREPELQKEKNYFFKLSEFTQKLTDLFESDTVKILPESRKNEILGKLNLGLQDLSVSREGVSWGIPVPWDNKQTIYVWVEALCNYYTATRFLEGKEKFWPADIHLVGKDILWFHTVIWCAMLLAAEIELPKIVFAHGFFTLNGQKMSKSLGNVIAPNELVDKYGVDGTRYLLLSAFPFGDDGDFSFDKLTTKYNADLANSLGNLVSRVAKLAEGKSLQTTDYRLQLSEHKKYQEALENFKTNDALEYVFNKVGAANKYIDENKPWTLQGETLQKILEHLVADICEIAHLLKPFLPETAQKIEEQFKDPEIKSGAPLFPRL